MIVTGSIAIRARWALVHDGSAARIVNDCWVLVEGDHVAAITGSRPASANTVVDKPHLLVLPGFINLHNHIFTELMIRGRNLARLRTADAAGQARHGATQCCRTRGNH